MVRPGVFEYKLIKGTEVTEDKLAACAQLFSQNYGIWSNAVSPPLKPGSRIKMNSKRLREQCVGNPAESMVALCFLKDDEGKRKLIGQAFATMWNFKGEVPQYCAKFNYGTDLLGLSRICWITQLVVSSEWRECGIATYLLKLLPGLDFKCSAMGLVSSHPAACLTLAKRTHIAFRKLNLDYIQENAQIIMETSPVAYLKSAPLHRVQDDTRYGPIFSAFTAFYVDHEEPLAALKRWEEQHDMKWPLGALLEGHEYLCIVPLVD